MEVGGGFLFRFRTVHERPILLAGNGLPCNLDEDSWKSAYSSAIFRMAVLKTAPAETFDMDLSFIQTARESVGILLVATRENLFAENHRKIQRQLRLPSRGDTTSIHLICMRL